MKLGIIQPPEGRSFAYAKDLGLDFVEFDCNPTAYFGRPMSELLREQAVLKGESERTGVEVAAVGRWASTILDERGEIIPEEWEETKAVIDFGGYLGAKYYLCSVAYVPGLSYYKNITSAIRVLRQFVEYAGSRGMECAIVNCMMGNNYIRTPEQWRLVLDEVPGLGIKYDPSHSFVHGGPQGAYLEEAMEWGGHFKYVHIKGVIQKGNSIEPEHWERRALAEAHPELKPALLDAFAARNRGVYDNLPAGLDVINWRAFFGALYMHNYDGCLSIEPHSSTWTGEKGDKGVQYTVRMIRDLMILD